MLSTIAVLVALPSSPLSLGAALGVLVLVTVVVKDPLTTVETTTTLVLVTPVVVVTGAALVGLEAAPPVVAVK